jgi:hypothetical protein
VWVCVVLTCSGVERRRRWMRGCDGGCEVRRSRALGLTPRYECSTALNLREACEHTAEAS